MTVEKELEQLPVDDFTLKNLENQWKKIKQKTKTSIINFYKEITDYKNQ